MIPHLFEICKFYFWHAHFAPQPIMHVRKKAAPLTRRSPRISAFPLPFLGYFTAFVFFATVLITMLLNPTGVNATPSAKSTTMQLATILFFTCPSSFPLLFFCHVSVCHHYNYTIATAETQAWQKKNHRRPTSCGFFNNLFSAKATSAIFLPCIKTQILNFSRVNHHTARIVCHGISLAIAIFLLNSKPCILQPFMKLL